MIISIVEHILIQIAFSMVFILILISISFQLFLVDEIGKLSDSSDRGMVVTFLCLTSFLVTHSISLGHFPLSNLSESFIFISWSLSFIHTIPHLKKNNTKLLRKITNSSVSFIQVLATSCFLKEIQKDSLLVPVLQSEWLIMHVSMMVMGYAALLCGSLLSVAFMMITFRNNQKFFFKINPFFSMNNYYKIQFSQELDFWSYRIISLGFIFLTSGLVSGAVWANETWGSYWSWDPKETWSFITWLVFTIYLHIRRNKNFEGTKSAIVASIGFFIIWICYFGVNLIGLGLHSYGFFPST
uniref:cytochrome c heme attachment protein n=1 Tax=Cuscuta corymbosa var. stylosa TaxID=437254 RepID=UPI002435E8AB|nr:cytochrome c heme attachment protein [Cuscuta corymbosa var. stylosa]WEY29950.1 cytochrome c heme attachment protein [Cuscuta corymbosa var. stylosa]